MQFFVSFIPAGKSNISYEVRVTQEGTFRIPEMHVQTRKSGLHQQHGHYNTTMTGARLPPLGQPGDLPVDKALR